MARLEMWRDFQRVACESALNGGDKPLFGGVSAEGRSERLDKEGNLVHLLWRVACCYTNRHGAVAQS